jgi:hypothetical protein
MTRGYRGARLPDFRCNGKCRCRGSNRRTICLGRGVGTPRVVGAGERKSPARVGLNGRAKRRPSQVERRISARGVVAPLPTCCPPLSVEFACVMVNARSLLRPVKRVPRMMTRSFTQRQIALIAGLQLKFRCNRGTPLRFVPCERLCLSRSPDVYKTKMFSSIGVDSGLWFSGSRRVMPGIATKMGAGAV